MNSLNTARLSLTCLALFCSSAFAVEYETTADYIAISFEAEEFTSKDERWVLTNAGTNQLSADEDPDPNHSDTASGGVYFELLPDIRVTHEDPIIGAFWGPPGVGPEMSWSINVPEPGRYYVHGRAYSTGTEDNGIHIGFNNTWPTSGRTMQFCTAGKRAWSWSSNQRGSGGGSCGIAKTLYLDFETAGPHIIGMSAREDGFELDKLTLIKDLSGNTRICTPTTATAINCRNGSIDMLDDQTNIAVELQATPETVADGTEELSAGSTFSVSALVENLDNFDHATDIVVMTEFAEGLDVTSVPSSCIESGQIVMCNLDSLEPTGAGEHHAFTFDVTVLETGAAIRSVDVNVENSLIDSNLANNTDSIDVQVVTVDLSTDVGVALSLQRDLGGDDTVWAVGELGSLNLLVTNESANNAGTVIIDGSLSAGFEVDLLPAACSAKGDNDFVCAISNLGAGQSRDLQVDISASNQGGQTVSVLASAANDTNRANDSDTVIVIIRAEPVLVIEVETPDADVTEETNNETNGGLPLEGTDEVTGQIAGVVSEELLEEGAISPVDVSTSRGGSGALSWQAFFALLLLVSASVYGRHKRQAIAIR